MLDPSVKENCCNRSQLRLKHNCNAIDLRHLIKWQITTNHHRRNKGRRLRLTNIQRIFHPLFCMIEHDDIIVVNPHSTNGVAIYLQTTIGVLAKIYDFPHYHYHHHQRIIQSVNINFGSEPAGFLFPLFSLLNRFPTYQHC